MYKYISILFLFNAPNLFAQEVLTNDTQDTISQAVDFYPSNNWAAITTEATDAFFLDTTKTTDGIDALRTNTLSDNGISELQTTIVGPGLLDFSWAISSEENHDFFNFYLDNTLTRIISGEVDFLSEAINIPAGQHTIAWRYQKDNSAYSGQDAAWLDNIHFTADFPTVLDYNDINGTWGVNTNSVSSNATFLVTQDHIISGSGALQTSKLSDNENVSLSYNFTNVAGFIQFYWSVSSEPEYDQFTFSIDGVPQQSISGEIPYQKEVFYLPAGNHTLTWEYAKDDSLSEGSDIAWLDHFTFTPDIISEAVEYIPSDAWRTNTTSTLGEAFVRESVAVRTHDGVDSIRTAPLSDDESASLGVFITGPSLLTFYWAVSSEADYDVFSVYLDGTSQSQISGEQSFEKYTINIPAGEHSIEWIYSKDASQSSGEDAAWLDNISVTPVATILISDSFE